MLEIFLILTMLVWPAMAKRRPKRRFTLRPVRGSGQLTLSTLASATALTGTMWGAADGAYRVMSVSRTWALRALTAGEGPIHVGYAHGDYTVTEIKEFIENSAAISVGDKIAQEKANRLIRVIGSFNGLSTNEVLNDGKPMKTRLNWFIPIGTVLNQFAYNDSGATLTTGAVVDGAVTGWVKDT